jgi:hypothetical protein
VFVLFKSAALSAPKALSSSILALRIARTALLAAQPRVLANPSVLNAQSVSNLFFPLAVFLISILFFLRGLYYSASFQAFLPMKLVCKLVCGVLPVVTRTIGRKATVLIALKGPLQIQFN